MKVLFITLKTFSVTGGIEKFNRSFAKALWQNGQANGWDIEMLSAYDGLADEAYFPNSAFKGFGGSKKKFSLQAINSIRKADLVVFGHINLAIIALISRALFPAKKTMMIAHGREVWAKLSWPQQKAIAGFTQILSVSRFTSAALMKAQHVPAHKIVLFPNTLDPYFGKLDTGLTVEGLRGKFGLASSNQVIITVARLANTERNKGYDEILEALPNIVRQFPNVRYMLCGKADLEEKNRILLRISELNLQNVVILTGFVADDELPVFYKMADLFAMPSRKEGFGIVFIEAAWWGLPVIAGNQDGSTDALLDGMLGSLVNPTDIAALETAIVHTLSQRNSSLQKDTKRALVEEKFGFDKFQQRQQDAILAVFS